MRSQRYLQYVQLTKSLISEELSLLERFPMLILHNWYTENSTDYVYIGENYSCFQ